MLINEKKILQSVKQRLSTNYISGTDDILIDIIKDTTRIANDIAGLRKDEERLNPYIKSAVIAEYLKRGAEGMLSRSEGGISSSFEDIVDKMQKNIVKGNLRRLK